MKILIIESESYLAQSVSNKLIEAGFETFSAHTLSENEDSIKYDVVLASANAINKRYEDLLRKYGDSIIILMISYVSDDTVNRPLNMGIMDYILKPFVIDELIRKISHYKTYKKLLGEVDFYRSYFQFISSELGTPAPFSYNPPFVIKASTQRSADIYAMQYAQAKGIRLNFVNLKKDWQMLIKNNPDRSQVYYLTQLESLKKAEKKEVKDFVIKHNMIMSCISIEKVTFPQVIDITDSNFLEMGGDIVSVKEYEKMVIMEYENRYTDIDLAKKLGVSRKSLWEKRKKYGINKKYNHKDND